MLSRRHFPVLDGWRGVAILVVVFHNAGSAMEADGSVVSTLVRSTLAVGWVGVSLFFVLSGFLITGILLDTRGSPGFLRSFYVRRTLRIFPLYYAVLMGVFLFAPLVVPPGEWTRRAAEHQVWFWTYLQNWTMWSDDVRGLGHFWSLAVEEQFYLVWPFVVLLFGTRWFPYVVGAVLVGSVSGRFLMHWGGVPDQALYLTTVARADSLAVGAFLAVAMRADWGNTLRRRSGSLLAFVSLSLAAVILMNQGLEPYDLEVLLYGQTLVAFLFGLLVLVTVDPTAVWQRRAVLAVDRPLLRRLGKYSYAIYVFHFPVHLLLLPRVSPFLAGDTAWERAVRILVYCAALLAFTTGLALLSWHLLERRFLALKDRWAPRPGRPGSSGGSPV